MQAQITAEREKRALIAASERRKQEQINIATGEREASIARSEGEKQAAIKRAQGEAAAIIAIATATAEALRQTGAAIREPGGLDAVNLKVAERYVEAFSKLAKTNKRADRAGRPEQYEQHDRQRAAGGEVAAAAGVMVRRTNASAISEIKAIVRRTAATGCAGPEAARAGPHRCSAPAASGQPDQPADPAASVRTRLAHAAPFAP